MNETNDTSKVEKEMTIEQKAKQELNASQARVRGEKRVKIRLPILPEKADNEVFCGVNGQNYRIKRGETVEVPASIEEVLRNCGYI